jgi:hypothetical protein
MAITPSPLFPFDSRGVLNAPRASGVYALLDTQGRHVFFGESDDVQRQLHEHLNEPASCLKRRGASHFAFELHTGESERRLRLDTLRRQFHTECNQKLGSR